MSVSQADAVIFRVGVIPERLRGVFTTRHCANPCLPYLTLPRRGEGEHVEVESKFTEWGWSWVS